MLFGTMLEGAKKFPIINIQSRYLVGIPSVYPPVCESYVSRKRIVRKKDDDC